MKCVNLSLSHLGSRSKFVHLERQNRPSFGTSVSIVASDELNEVVCETARQAFSEAPLVVLSHLVMKSQVYLLDSKQRCWCYKPWFWQTGVRAHIACGAALKQCLVPGSEQCDILLLSQVHDSAAEPLRFSNFAGATQTKPSQ